MQVYLKHCGMVLLHSKESNVLMDSSLHESTKLSLTHVLTFHCLT